MNANPRLHSFIGGSTGPWLVTSSRTITGEALPAVARLDYTPGRPEWSPGSGGWILSGVTSNDRYVTRPEKEQLLARQPALGRRLKESKPPTTAILCCLQQEIKAVSYSTKHESHTFRSIFMYR